MGTFAEGTVNIYFNEVKDADKVHELLTVKKPEETFKKFLGEGGEGYYEFYDFSDNGEKEIGFQLSSSRVQNAEWQMEQIIKLLKVLVKNKEISGVAEFTGDLMVQGEGYYCQGDEFEEGGEDE